MNGRNGLEKIFALKKTSVLWLKRWQGFCSSLLAGTEEPFTIHVTASWEAPASLVSDTSRIALDMWCHLYKKEGKLNPNLLWYISTDIQNGTSQRIFEAVSRQLGSSRSSAESQPNTSNSENGKGKRKKSKCCHLVSWKRQRSQEKRSNNWPKTSFVFPKSMSAAVERVKSPYQEVRKRNYGYFSDECARSLLVCWLLSIYIYIYKYIIIYTNV